MDAKKLYTLLWIACFAGYGWLYYSYTHQTEPVGVCMFKEVTHIPCPSCGTTRAVVNIAHGQFTEALFMNPLGYCIAGIMVLFPLWLIRDHVTRHQSLYHTYRHFEQTVKRPFYAIPLVVLLVANWVWTITKGL